MLLCCNVVIASVNQALQISSVDIYTHNLKHFIAVPSL